MKGKTPKRQNGDCTVEEEDLREVEVEMEEEGATQDQDHQEGHRVEETQSPRDPTCPRTYDPFPVPMMRNQWENSPTSSTGIEPRRKHLLTNLTTTSY